MSKTYFCSSNLKIKFSFEPGPILRKSDEKLQNIILMCFAFVAPGKTTIYDQIKMKISELEYRFTLITAITRTTLFDEKIELVLKAKNKLFSSKNFSSTELKDPAFLK